MDKKNTIDSAFSCDYYHILMGYNYFKTEFKDKIVCYEFFFRHLAFKGGYAIFAGLGSFLQTISRTTIFDEMMVDYLEKIGIFSEEFLSYLKNWKFTGSIWAATEGEIVFPNAPLIRIQGNILECLLLESFLLNIINYQSLVATKSSRITLTANNKPFVEMGLRRAYGPNGSLFATRASFIGGALSTSNVLAASCFNIPLVGSMSHSWVMSYPNEVDSFIEFGRVYPNNQIFLLDTYNTLKQGLPNAVKAFKTLEKEGFYKPESLRAVRIDSGDLDYLSKNIRIYLDEHNLKDVKIMASDNINEDILMQLQQAESPIDFFGVGTQLVSKFNSDFSGVYKLVAMYDNNIWEPKIKISENPQKTTIAGRKNIIRIFNNESIALIDYVILEEEQEEILQQLNQNQTLTVYYPFAPYLKRSIKNYFSYKLLLSSVVSEGSINQNLIDNSLQNIQEYSKNSLKTFHASHKRIVKPHRYRVGYSHKVASITWKALSAYNNQN